MGTSKNPVGETVESARRRETIQEMQRIIARELRNGLEPLKDLPQRLADLARELHRRLRNSK